MFGAIAGGIASALAGGAMSKLFGGGQKAASGGIQGDVLATDNNTVDRKSGSAGMPRPTSYAVFCSKKKTPCPSRPWRPSPPLRPCRPWHPCRPWSTWCSCPAAASATVCPLSLHDALPISSALAGGAMSKLFGGGQKAASGGIQGDVLATDNNT